MRKQLDPEIKNKLIAYVRKEHGINRKSKIIMLKGAAGSLSEVEKITQERIRVLKKQGFQVYSQGNLFSPAVPLKTMVSKMKLPVLTTINNVTGQC